MRVASGTPTLESPTRLTVPERQELGRLARTRLPRSSLANYAPARDRPDPLALLESQAATRVAELVPIRYGRMLASPFSFYRGAALIMASDLATEPHTELQVQLCGDAHLSNFGLFASPERNLVFDIDDFDETLPGPSEIGCRAGSSPVSAVPGPTRLRAPRHPNMQYRPTPRAIAGGWVRLRSDA